MAPTRAQSPKPASRKSETEQNSGEDNVNSKTEAIPEKTEKKNSPKTAVIVALVCFALFAASKYFGSKVDIKAQLEKAADFVERQGDIAVYWYCAFTFIGVICLVPTTLMELAGGFLFHGQYGLWVYIFTGASKLCANVVSVIIARNLIKDLVMEKIVKKSELLTMVADAVKDEPWKMAFLVRGSMVPLFVKNYGLGVTDIGYLPNACCSMIFTNFYAAQNIYMGSTMSNLKEVFAPKKAGGGPQDWASTVKAILPIVLNILLVVVFVKALKKQFKKQRAEIEEKLKKKTDKKAD